MSQQRQQVVQLRVNAEVVIKFMGEGKKIFGSELTLRRVAVANEGPFLKILPGPGSSESGRLFHFDIVAGVEIVAGQIQVTGQLPTEPRQ